MLKYIIVQTIPFDFFFFHLEKLRLLIWRKRMHFLSFPNPSAFLLITHWEDFAVSSKTLYLRLCRWVGISQEVD